MSELLLQEICGAKYDIFSVSTNISFKNEKRNCQLFNVRKAALPMISTNLRVVNKYKETCGLKFYGFFFQDNYKYVSRERSYPILCEIKQEHVVVLSEK